MSDSITCSMSACLAMILLHYREQTTPLGVTELFGNTFLSENFHRWNINTIDLGKYEISEMMACAQYMINNLLHGFSADIIPTDVSKIKLSYIKRGIPVIITGKFPLLSGKTSNSVLVKGYVDEYLIVNDPRGNANAGYRDQHGENMVYHCKDLSKWVTYDRAYILRILRKPSTVL